MTGAVRRAALILALAAYAVVCVRLHLARRDPEGSLLAWPPPTPAALGTAADGRLEAATAVLQGSADAAARAARYRAEIEAADRDLARSLALLPAQPRAIAKLAAIRWELDPPATDEAERSLRDLVVTAASMAPGVPEVQYMLGSLLLRMGRDDEGLRYLHRALELTPSRSGDAVGLLREIGWTASRMAEALPATPEVLAALYLPASDDGALADYVERIEPLVAGHLVALANTYGSACIQTGQADRLAALAERIGARTDPEQEAARLLRVARAAHAAGRPAAAIAPSRRASDLAPSVPWVQEIAGQLLLAADRPDEAIVYFRRALTAVARFPGWESYRASVYVQIGACEERRFRPDRAFDEYKRALAVDPSCAAAAAALDRIRRGTGLKP